MGRLIEMLEGRRLLSTVSWDGGAADGKYTSAANWSTDQVPAATDDIVIATNGPKSLTMTGDISVHSMTVSSNITFGIYGADASTVKLNVADSIHVLSGGGVAFYSGVVTGAGKLTVDAGGSWNAIDGGGHGLSGDILIPVDNYGSMLISGSHDLGPAFHNYASLTAYEFGACYGNFYNEVGGSLAIATVPNQPGDVTFGLKRAADGTVSPGVFVNHGSIRVGFSQATGLPYLGPGHYDSPLIVYVDASPTIGGTWNTSGAQVTFASYVTATPSTVTFDSTFSLTSGWVFLRQVNATVRGFAPDTGLTLQTTGTNPHTEVTLAQDRTALALLQVTGSSTLHLPTSGTQVLRAEDLTVDATARLDIGDNLLIDGNHPGYLRTYPANPPAPYALPPYQAVIRGSSEGVPLTVATGVDPNASSSRAVGFSNGAGLAQFFASHTFRSETFDDNDFVFFATMRGDANFDRTVDFNDLAALAQHYNTTTIRGYADGNFDNPAVSGNVDFNDLVALAQNYGQTFSIATPIIAPLSVPTATATTTSKRQSVGRGVLE